MMAGALQRIHLGHGVYETLRTHPSGMWQEARHMARLARGAEVLGLELPEDMRERLADLVAPDRRIRIDLHGGDLDSIEGPGVATVSVTHRPFVLQSEPIRLCTTPVQCPPQPWSGIKTTSMFGHVQARRWALARGFEDGLLVHGDEVVEASTANVFALVDGQWHAPGAEAGAVDGVTRQVLLDQVAAVPRLSSAQLARATAVALTNTAGIRPATDLDGRTLAVEPVAALQAVFDEAWQCA
ncbi:MAG: aminotransferase class IV [Thermoplasmatota archaeon]